MSRSASGLAIAGRLGWGVADQAVSSLSNFVLGAVVARSLGVADFGAFSLVFITYAFVLSASRGVSTDPLLVRYSGPEDARWARAVSAASGTAVAFGATAGVACLLMSLVLPGSVGQGFAVLGLTAWALLLQDSFRFAFFAAGRPRAALLNDLVWGALLLLGLVGLHELQRLDVVTCIAVLGGTAALAALLGYVQCRVAPSPRSVRGWLVEHKALGPRYLIENVAIGGARQLRFFLLGGVAGLAAVGATRGGEILMGPFLVILMGVSQMAVPEASHVLSRAPQRLVMFCLAIGSVAAAAAASWGVLVHLLLPMGIGTFVLGPMWVHAAALLPPIVIGFAMGGFEIGAAAGVRALGAARRSLAAQLLCAALYAVLGVGGALLDGARGSCWGVALATTLGAGIWWLQLHRGVADHVAGASGSDEPQDRAERMLHEPDTAQR